MHSFRVSLNLLSKTKHIHIRPSLCSHTVLLLAHPLHASPLKQAQSHACPSKFYATQAQRTGQCESTGRRMCQIRAPLPHTWVRDRASNQLRCWLGHSRNQRDKAVRLLTLYVQAFSSTRGSSLQTKHASQRIINALHGPGSAVAVLAGHPEEVYHLQFTLTPKVGEDMERHKSSEHI